MKKSILYDSHRQFEREQWKREIAFWKEEIKAFNNRLSELITRCENEEEIFQIEYYQKKFILHGDVTEDLLVTIEKQESQVFPPIEAGTIMLDTQLSEGHIEFRNRMKKQRDLYAQLKRNFFKFFEKYL